jgi:hypothetical protein
MKIFILILLSSATLSLFVGANNYIFSSERNLKYYTEVNDSLYAVSSYIDEYYKSKNIYPSNRVLKAWANKNSSLHSDVSLSVRLHANDYPVEVTDNFNIPNSEGYALTIWTGDFFISYASWVKKISVDLSPPIAKYILMAVVLYFISWLLWSQHLTRR